jgi:hypothetical protein
VNKPCFRCGSEMTFPVLLEQPSDIEVFNIEVNGLSWFREDGPHACTRCIDTLLFNRANFNHANRVMGRPAYGSEIVYRVGGRLKWELENGLLHLDAAETWPPRYRFHVPLPKAPWVGMTRVIGISPMRLKLERGWLRYPNRQPMGMFPPRSSDTGEPHLKGLEPGDQLTLIEFGLHSTIRSGFGPADVLDATDFTIEKLEWSEVHDPGSSIILERALIFVRS